MKIAVVGAGAVGCYFGGQLARGGHDVLLIGRPSHVDAIRANGLRFESPTFDGVVPVRASTAIADAAFADVVLFCVKSADTASVGAELAPFLRPDTLVMSLQNGVDNAERLRGVIVHTQVAAVVVYVACEMAGPGHVLHHGRGELVMEPAMRSAEVVTSFGAAFVPTRVSVNVRGELWAKLILNCAYNAMSAITQTPYAGLLAVPSTRAVMRDIIDESLAVAHADGVDVPGDLHVSVPALAEIVPGQYSSTAQDMARGKPTEIDYLNGYVVSRGDALGVPAPVNRTLLTLVKILEAKR